MAAKGTLSLHLEETSMAVTAQRYRPPDRTDRSIRVGNLSGVSVSRWGSAPRRRFDRRDTPAGPIPGLAPNSARLPDPAKQPPIYLGEGPGV